MADIALFQNNATSTLASPITNVALLVTVVPGAGALFPNPGAGQYFIMTFVDQATRLVREIVHVTSRTADTMTIVRGQEGTAPAAWNAGDIAAQIPTAGTYQLFTQVTQAQTAASNYAIDTGSANNLVAALSPAVTGRVTGLTVRIKAANSNSGSTTIDIGAGPIATVNPDGSALGSGAIIGGGVIEIVDLGSGPYQLISSSQQAQSLSGAATTGDFKWRPTTETIAGWIIAAGLTIGNALSNATARANADAANLFAWVWNNFSNTQCPTFNSAGSPIARGANAAADFAANKQILPPDMRGLAMLGMDNMQSHASNFYNGVPVSFGSAATAGSIIGENLHTLITAELAVHSHANTSVDTGHTHGVTVNSGSIIVSAAGSGFGGGGASGGGSITINSASANIVVTNVNTGSGTAHNTVDRGMVGTIYIKL